MSILVLTLLCVYVHYNALGLYIKLFALYKNIFFMKVIKTEIRFKTGFQQPKTGFPKNLVLTSLVLNHDILALRNVLNCDNLALQSSSHKEPSVYDVHTKGDRSGLGVWGGVSSMWMTTQKIRAH